MTWRHRYESARQSLLADSSVHPTNRDLFRTFFEYEEYKLKRQNGLSGLDEPCCKTLYGYTVLLRNTNRWFDNRPWTDLTREDIRRVYDDLEEGRIRTHDGRIYQDRRSYYNKIFKGKPFKLAGKADLAQEVIEFSTPHKKAVRYLTEDQFRAMVSVVSNPKHLLLLWLAWDVGENVGSLLQLTKRDLLPQINRFNQESEYLVALPDATLKRSRQHRSEPTLYPETAHFADMVLATAVDGESLFGFGHRQAACLLRSIARKSGARTKPYGEEVRWKDFRSGMACHLLRNGWTRDEVNARLGHTPHSRALDAYINFLALDRDAPKQRMMHSAVSALQDELNTSKQAAAVVGDRLQHTVEENLALRGELLRTRADIERIQLQLAGLAAFIQRVVPDQDSPLRQT